MLGVVLMYVAIVLISNGICSLSNIDGRTTSIMNLFVGSLSVIVNIISIVFGAISGDNALFYATATGLLFGFTYLFVACNHLFALDVRAYGWYSLFVAINTLPAAYISYTSMQESGIYFALIWLAWGGLWLCGFVENVLKIRLTFVPFLSILEGIFTAWIPAWLLLVGYWK